MLYAEGSNAVQNNVVANKGKKQGTSTVENSGVLDARLRDSETETGGTISVLADNVGITERIRFSDASGDVGGGTLKIGGDFPAQGTTPTLNTVR